MATNIVQVVPPFQITPAPVPLLVPRQDGSGTSSKKKTFQYPACYNDADGPCKLMSSSSNACSKQFPEPSFYNRMYCTCTNGYLERSSECFVDCFTDLSRDMASVSRRIQIQALSCSIYALEIPNQEALSSKLRAISEARENRGHSLSVPRGVGDDMPITAGDTFPGLPFPTGGLPNPTGGLSGEGGEGADIPDADGVAEDTVKWEERPTSTDAAQQRSSTSANRGVNHYLLFCSIISLALAPILSG